MVLVYLSLHRLSLRQTAAKLGISTATVAADRDRLRLPANPPGGRRAAVTVQEAREAYERLSLEAAGAELGCSGATIRNRLMEGGVERRPRGHRGWSPATLEQLDAVVPLYTELGSLRAVGDQIGRTHIAVRERLKRRGVPRNAPGAWVRVARAREYASSRGLLMYTEAAKMIAVSEPVMTYYCRKELLQPAETVTFGGLTFQLFDPQDVKPLMWWRYKNPASRRWLERMPARDLRAWEKRAAAVRVGIAGRRPSLERQVHLRRLAELFERLRAEEDEFYARDVELGLAAERRSDYHLQIAAAKADYREHPDRWPYDPADAPEAAAERVRRATKVLQNAPR
jgi:hypothetical protein